MILIFSVNKSSQFQGFAKMTSHTTNKQEVFQTVGKIFPLSSTDQSLLEGVNLGGCFYIKWLRTTRVPFSNIQHLKNPLKEDEPIKKSRDC